MINVIIPSAGKGRRFSKNKPKQFFKIGNKEIILINLEKWLKIKEVNRIYLVLPDENFDNLKKKYENVDSKIFAIKGGNTRSESIYNAVKLINEDNEFTFIHDGARPFFKIEIIDKLLKELKFCDAVIPALKLTDTIKKINGNRIVETVNRDDYVRVQTPQAFRTKIIKNVYERVSLKENYFDDAQLLEKEGLEVCFIEGDKENIKITEPQDMAFAEFLYGKDGIL